MIKHTQKIRRQCVFDDFVELALNGLTLTPFLYPTDDTALC